jgi:hypothetical protein
MYNVITASYKLSTVTDNITLTGLPMNYYLDQGITAGGRASYPETVSKGGYRLQHYLESIKITNSSFKTINFSFPDTTLIPIFSSIYTENIFRASAFRSTLLPFIGTNSIILSSNANLTDITFDSYIFQSYRTYIPPLSNIYNYPFITVLNNPKLTSFNCYINFHLDKLVASPAGNINFNIYDSIKNVNLTINNNGLSSRTKTAYTSDYLDAIKFTFNQNSSAIETFNLTLTSNNQSYPLTKVTNIILSAANSPIPVVNAYRTPDANYMYSSGADTYFNTPYLDLSKVNKLPFISLSSTEFNYNTKGTLFIKLKNTTQMDFISSAASNNNNNGLPNILTIKFTGDPIPAEKLSKYILDNNKPSTNMRFIDYDLIPIKTDTLLYEQHKMVTEPLSGKKQPYSFYNILSANPWNIRDENGATNNRVFNGVNPGFGMNKNSVYTWPLSVLNNTNISTGIGDYAANIIHPRFAVTASHLDPGDPGTPLPRSVSFRDLNTGNLHTTNIISKYTIPGTDIALYELNPVLPVSAFPGFYILPKSLFQANSATKIPLWLHGFDIPQDRDVTPSAWAPWSDGAGGMNIEKRPVISSDEGTYLSYKNIRGGDSGSPKICFINKKPVILMTYYYNAGGPFLTYYTDQIQAKLDELAGAPVTLNYITQDDLNVYADLYT